MIVKGEAKHVRSNVTYKIRKQTLAQEPPAPTPAEAPQSASGSSTAPGRVGSDSGAMRSESCLPDYGEEDEPNPQRACQSVEE